eukprot:CAMPEP_0115508332 /NCGR_PEP_ID=MMETSP0271-20121206/72248_1 /TAXON_ID=71861 /ORGANISM="Scrippsiella trochoidea, Strain CCMP3099" /LENGTH=135 /DNA_ID=CAMNT_0002938073 /DNA_START=89 /DNA_END=493 /DNA_ORIENTATION=-
MADGTAGPAVTFVDVQDTNQAASAAFIQHIRQTLQRAQEITQMVSEAENIADEATKFCEAIKTQHNIQPKKLALTGAKPATPVPPLAASLTREIQTSVVWTQTGLTAQLREALCFDPVSRRFRGDLALRCIVNFL